MGLVLTLGLWLWEARTTLRLTAGALGLLLLALTAPVLVAGLYSDEAAAASALRWGLAISFLVISVPLWLRTTLSRQAIRCGIHSGNARTAQLVRGGLLAFAALPVVALSVWMAVVVFMGLTPGGPGEDSFFFRSGDFTSHLFPLSLVLIGLTGHALREWSEEDAFAGGVVTLMIVMGGYALSVIQAGESMAWNDWVILLQAGTIAASLWALGWMVVVWRMPRGFFGATRRHGSLLPSGSLMRVQVLLAVVGNVILLLLGLPRLVITPAGIGVADLLIPLGNVGGWAAFTVGLLALLVYARRFRSAWEPHVLGGAMLVLGVMSAFVLARWDDGNWVAYHALLLSWTVGAWALGTALPFVGAVRLNPITSGAPRTDWKPVLPPRDHSHRSYGLALWIGILGALVVGLAVRGAWEDPARPYVSSAAVLAVAILAGISAVRRQRLLDAIIAAALLDLAGVLVWISIEPHRFTRFVCVNILGVALASVVWTIVALVQRARIAREEAAADSAFVFDFARPLRHGAALASAIALAGCAIFGFVSMGVSAPTPINDVLGWCTWSAAVLAVGLCLWDAGARFPLPALYGSGLTAIVILLQGGEGTLALLARVSMLLLAGYVLLTSLVACVARARESWLQSLRLPWPLTTSENWFLRAQAGVGVLALLLSLGVTLAQDTVGERFMGPLAVVLLMLAGAMLAGFAVESKRRSLRMVTLLLGVVMLMEAGWAVFDPSANAIGLHRIVAVLIALAVATVMYGFGLPRLIRENVWGLDARRLAPVLGLAASAVVAVVLLLEGLAFDAVSKHTPLGWLEILTVLAALAGLVTAGIAFAVVPWADPFRLSERRRPYFVYGAELMLVFLFLHLRFNVPELFRLINVEYWTFCVMFVAFVGVGLSEFFHRRKLHVLASPLQRTGIFLPLLPLLAFWLNPPEALREPLVRIVPRMDAILSPFQGIPGFTFDRYAVLWFLLGMLYAGLALSRRSFRFALAASLAANVGLWVVLGNHGPSFLVNPQLWLIPLALIVLVSEAVNRRRLSRELSTGLRYLGLGMLYLSSTADMFIAGLGNSVGLPILLALLSVLGVLAGILFRIRSYVYLGVAFLVLDILSMIWHAAVDLAHVWVWWASGIVLGAAILALFAVFEKRRQHVLHLVEDFRTWR
jgi:hypothetical protein